MSIWTEFHDSSIKRCNEHISFKTTRQPQGDTTKVSYSMSVRYSNGSVFLNTFLQQKVMVLIICSTWTQEKQRKKQLQCEENPCAVTLAKLLYKMLMRSLQWFMRFFSLDWSWAPTYLWTFRSTESSKKLHYNSTVSFNLLNSCRVELFLTDVEFIYAGDSRWVSRQTSWVWWRQRRFGCKWWSVLLVMWWVRRVASGGESDGPSEVQLEVPGLNADSLRVIKNSLS